ncbi:MAG: glycosyltransferase [Thermoanaerobaculales bacterium]
MRGVMDRDRFRALLDAHWDRVAREWVVRRGLGGDYRRRLAQVYRFCVPPAQRVLELGCGRGDLLAALQPCHGVGLDLSAEMLRQARQRHPEMLFVRGDAEELPLGTIFDVVVLSDLLNDLWDVQGLLEAVKQVTTPRTRLIINTRSRVWELPLRLAQRLGLAHPLPAQNWLTVADIKVLLGLAGFEVVRHWGELLVPVRIPVLGRLANRVLARLWPFNFLCFTNFIVARPVGPTRGPQGGQPTVSVVIPARNEEGNIASVVDRVPEMGGGTEIVFVEGHSTDDTWGAIGRAIASAPDRQCTTLRQSGVGKGDAVRAGFERARGDILMILDADLTVSPGDLPRFFAAIVGNKGELINGVRLVYPLADRAMRFSNLVANRLFSVAFSWLIGQPVKDTLCGTKVLWREDYRRIASQRSYFGELDPFGDFDLLFGAAKLNLRIVDLPIRYHQRTYGVTNIARWKDGWRLIKMVALAAVRLKFV